MQAQRRRQAHTTRHHFTAPPADHDQPTGALTLADLAHHTRVTDHLRE